MQTGKYKIIAREIKSGNPNEFDINTDDLKKEVGDNFLINFEQSVFCMDKGKLFALLTCNEKPQKKTQPVKDFKEVFPSHLL